jgi:hypothetical protein
LQGGATYSTDVPVCGPSSPELAETLSRDLWIGLSSFYRFF